MKNNTNCPNNKIIGLWQNAATINRNNFKHKSLSCWSLNPAVGCTHGCKFCYVPEVSARKLSPKLSPLGVENPDAEWGRYTFVRHWDEQKFLSSLRRAEKTGPSELNKDGNRAVMMSTTTDPYLVLSGGDPQATKQANEQLQHIVRRALELIRDHSTINVRILTRSPLVTRDLDLFQSLGARCAVGMSIPTLRNKLAKIYEPGAPAPTQRLKALQQLAAAGVPVFVAIAPTYPDCDETDLSETMRAVRKLDPLTVFHEPINIRADNAQRIKHEAEATHINVKIDTSVFETPTAWEDYALRQFRLAEKVAAQTGLSDRLHLWPDQTFGTKKFFQKLAPAERKAHETWLNRCWNRISEWPSKKAAGAVPSGGAR